MALLKENLSAEREMARTDTNKNPSEFQIKAGNYKKGKLKFNGLLITIENPKGSYRRGKDKNGHEWKTLMHNDYGYFNRTVGKDGDAIDVFLGPNLNSTKIFPIDQYNGENFDETKVMIGFNSAEEAKAAYLSNYAKGWKGFKYITEVDLDKFKKWLYDGHRQRKPFAKYVKLTENKERQLDIIRDTNPMLDDYHFGIRSTNDIKTFEEAMAEAKEDYEEYGTYSSYPDTPNSIFEKAMETGMITVYSSKPIVNGNFISTSKMCAKDYAGGGHVYSETLPVDDIAWLNVEEGQVARENTLNERKNDDGKDVPEKCACGGKVCVQIHGEPVFICDKCGKYYGTVPFVKESFNVTRALKQLKKRRDPANIENWNENMINEVQGLKSKKLYSIFKQYGRPFIAKHYDSSEAMDLHNVSDNDVVGVFKAERLPRTEGEEKKWISQMGFNIDALDSVRNIELGKTSEDGQIMYAVVINRNANYDRMSIEKDGGFKDYISKKNTRAQKYVGNGVKNYQWKDNDVKFDIMDNPYRKEWGKDAQQRLQDKMKAVYGNTYNKVKNISEDKKVNHQEDAAAAITKGRKIYLTEEQFKAYCRQILREKREKDYIKKIISESIDELYRLRNVSNVFDELKMAVEGAIDYLSNEGVVSYQEPALEQALEKGTLDYKDICKAALWYIENDKKFSDELRQMLQEYINTGSNPELVDKICAAISEYLDNATCY